ncbi:RNA-directed DNA polymerase, eukaryota, partial [Tanacetum coccineum]
VLDSGVKSDEILLSRLEVSRRLFNLNQSDFKDAAQQAKVKWAIEGDENSKFFHGVINKKRAQLAVRGVFNNGTWCTDPNLVKESFLSHFASRFKQPVSSRFKLNIPFINRLTTDQSVDLDCAITSDEIKAAVWDCGENKSPGPDGFTFEFFRHFWDLIALIPKVPDAKFVSDFRPISLIGSVYKVITKVLANRLGHVISDLVSNTQSAFIKNRQILDGPFILNEIIAWCKRKKRQSLIFKVDFAKAYDSVRWDFLLEVLDAFGFGPELVSWIRDSLWGPFLFILVMESLHLSVCRAVNDGIFKGLQLQDHMTLSHLFYADDVVFVGEWSDSNLANLIKILKCFHLASGLKINIQKSQVMGVGVPEEIVSHGAATIGCAVLHTPFKYLGVVVGDHMTRHSAWSYVIQKVQSRLSRWKANTLSIDLERIRSKFFIGANQSDRKMSWVAWDQVLAAKKRGGLGISSFYALNRALLLKWVWRYISQDGSLWYHIIRALYGDSIDSHGYRSSSCWSSILREVRVLEDKGFNFLSHCKIHVGTGNQTKFWLDFWVSDMALCDRFPRIFALETVKEVLVADKMEVSPLCTSFRRPIRDGVERQQWLEFLHVMDSVTLSLSPDRWSCDINGEGTFCVKDIRLLLDDIYLPSLGVETRWVKHVPIKVNVFAWRARLDRLPTRLNLSKRGILTNSIACPICDSAHEDVNHLFFGCSMAQDLLSLICRWWNLPWTMLGSFSDWDTWLISTRLSSKLKSLLEGVFLTAWWSIWSFRNRLLFDDVPPRRSRIFDDIVSCSFNWCSNRCSSFISKEFWYKNPYLISM